MKEIYGIMTGMKKLKIGVPIRYYSINQQQVMAACITEELRYLFSLLDVEMVPIFSTQKFRLAREPYDKIPELTEEERQNILNKIKLCDGLLIPGGGRFKPYDRLIIDYAVRNDVPMLCICLGAQLLSAFGQEKAIFRKVDTSHEQGSKPGVCHLITIEKDSKLFQIIGKTTTEVNSFHTRQANENDFFKITATSPDGVIEAIEKPDAQFCIGVQWHPEKDYSDNPDSRKLIDAFITAATQAASE